MLLRGPQSDDDDDEASGKTLIISKLPEVASGEGAKNGKVVYCYHHPLEMRLSY